MLNRNILFASALCLSGTAFAETFQTELQLGFDDGDYSFSESSEVDISGRLYFDRVKTKSSQPLFNHELSHLTSRVDIGYAVYEEKSDVSNEEEDIDGIAFATRYFLGNGGAFLGAGYSLADGEFVNSSEVTEGDLTVSNVELGYLFLNKGEVAFSIRNVNSEWDVFSQSNSQNLGEAEIDSRVYVLSGLTTMASPVAGHSVSLEMEYARAFVESQVTKRSGTPVFEPVNKEYEKQAGFTGNYHIGRLTTVSAGFTYNGSDDLENAGDFKEYELSATHFFTDRVAVGISWERTLYSEQGEGADTDVGIVLGMRI